MIQHEFHRRTYLMKACLSSNLGSTRSSSKITCTQFYLRGTVIFPYPSIQGLTKNGDMVLVLFSAYRIRTNLKALLFDNYMDQETELHTNFATNDFFLKMFTHPIGSIFANPPKVGTMGSPIPAKFFLVIL
jgi:hypothetical protein